MDLIKVFYAPKTATANMLEKKKFPWLVLVIMIAAPFLNLLLNYNYLWTMSYSATRAQYDLMGLDMPISQLQKIVTNALPIGIGSGAVFTVIQWLLFSLLIMLLAGMLGAETGYKNVLNMVGAANMITVAHIILSAFLILLGFDQVTFSLAMLVPSAKENILLLGVLQNINLFRVWFYVVVGLGMHQMVEKKRASIVAIVLVFLVSTVISVLPLLALPAAQ